MSGPKDALTVLSGRLGGRSGQFGCGVGQQCVRPKRLSRYAALSLVPILRSERQHELRPAVHGNAQFEGDRPAKIVG
jgi:hypothetical protein